MDWSNVILALAGLFLAGVVKGGTGLGFSSCALPFLVPAVGLPVAMTVILAPALATNLGVALTAGHFREVSTRFWVFYVATVPGIFIGMALLAICDKAVAVKLLGICVMSYALLALTRPDFHLPPALARRLQGPVGLANGVVAGFTGSQVVPLLPYMMSLGLEPGRMVQAINLSVMLSSIGLAAALAGNGLVTWTLAGLSLAAVIPAMVGVKLGTAWRQQLPEHRFRLIVLIALLVIGCSLAIR